MDRQAMTLALQTACKYETPDCLQKSEEHFGKYPTEPDRDQKLTVYCYGIQEGSEDDWNKLWNNYKSEINANELTTMRKALACSKDSSVLYQYLTYATEEVIRVQHKHTVINEVSSTTYGRDVSWTFIEENWDWFYDM